MQPLSSSTSNLITYFQSSPIPSPDLLSQSALQLGEDDYLSFLLTAYRKGIHQNIILEALKKADADGFNFTQKLAKTGSEKNVLFFIKFLDLIYAEYMNTLDEEGDDVEIQKNINEPLMGCGNVLSFTEYCMQRDKAKNIFYHLAKSSFLMTSEKIKLLNKADDIITYIYELEFPFIKTNALRDALDATHPLGQFFNNAYFWAMLVHKQFQMELLRLAATQSNKWRTTVFVQGLFHTQEENTDLTAVYAHKPSTINLF